MRQRKMTGGLDWTLIVVLLLVAAGASENKRARDAITETFSGPEDTREARRERRRMGRYLKNQAAPRSEEETKVTTPESGGEWEWPQDPQDGSRVRSWR